MENATRENSAVLFLDVQEGIVSHSHTVVPEKLVRSAGLLAKLTALHNLPHFLSAVQVGGPYVGGVLAALGKPEVRNRTQTTAFADSGIVNGLRKSGRKVVVLAGVASEVVVLRTALDAIAAGYTVHVAVDACGGGNARTEDAAFRRIEAAGGVMSSVTTFIAELCGDFTTDLGGKTLGIMLEALGG